MGWLRTVCRVLTTNRNRSNEISGGISNFFVETVISARHVRLITSNAVTLVATIAGKGI